MNKTFFALALVVASAGCAGPGETVGRVGSSVIVGPLGYRDLECYDEQTKSLAAGLGRFVPLPPNGADLASCSATLLDGRFAVTGNACINGRPPSKGQVVGVLEFGGRAASCGGSEVVAPRRFEARLIAVEQYIQALALVAAGKEIGGGGAASPGDAGILPAQISLEEPPVDGTHRLALAAHQGPALLATMQGDCKAETWNGDIGFGYPFLLHDCDTDPDTGTPPLFWAETSAGGPIVVDGYARAVHIWHWPIESQTINAGISFKTMSDWGFWPMTE